MIYHRHPGLPTCLITLSLTKSQSTSGPGAGGWGVGGRYVCIGTCTAHISPSKFYDGIAYRMRFLFLGTWGEGVGTPWKTKYYILISALSIRHSEKIRVCGVHHL